MKKPQFHNTPVYLLIVRDNNGEPQDSWFVNAKAWNKSLETSQFWEYIAENGRVIQKALPGLSPDFKTITITESEIAMQAAPALQKPQRESKGQSDETSILAKLETLLQERKREMPPQSYTTQLFQKGEEKILKKLGEEAVELILAKEDRAETLYETADLLYHLMVYFVYRDIPFSEVLAELESRMGK